MKTYQELQEASKLPSSLSMFKGELRPDKVVVASGGGFSEIPVTLIYKTVILNKIHLQKFSSHPEFANIEISRDGMKVHFQVEK